MVIKNNMSSRVEKSTSDFSLRNYELRSLFHQRPSRQPTTDFPLRNYELRKLFREPKPTTYPTENSLPSEWYNIFEPPFEVIQDNAVRNEHFQFTRYEYYIDSTRALTFWETNNALEELFRRLNALIADNNRIQLVISPDYRTDQNQSTGMIYPENFSLQWIQEKTTIFHNYHELEIQDLQFILYVYDIPAGNGNTLKILNNVDSKCIITVPGNYFL